MVAVPYALLRVQKNGGGLLTGGITAAHGDVIQLSAEHTATVKSWLWQIYEYPEGFPCPAGWSTDGSGIYYYSFGATPPSFTLPASTTLWGKYFFRLTVDGGVGSDGRPNTDLIDDRTAVDIPSPNGTEDMGFLESNQFDQQREVFGPLKRNLRLIDDMLDGVITGGGGSVGPLSLELYVDSDSSATPADGSIGAPYTTVQAAIDAATAGTTIRIVKFANGSHNLTIAKDITLVAGRDEGKRPFGGADRSGTTVQVGTLTITGTRLVGLSGLTTGAIACSAGTSTLTILDGADVGAITGGPVVRTSFADLSGTIACSGDSRFYSSRFLVNGTIISTSGTVLEIQGCRFTAGGNTIVFSGSAGTLYVDPIAHEYWIGVTETLTNGSLVVVGASLPTVDATLGYNGTTLRRAAISGDVVVPLGSNVAAFRPLAANSVLANPTTGSAVPSDVALGADDLLGRNGSGNVAATKLTLGMFGNWAALGVFARASNTTGAITYVQAAANDRMFRRVGDVLDFGQLTAGMIPNGLLTPAMLSNRTARSVFGRASNTDGVGADIVGTSNTVLVDTGTALTFAQVATAMLSDLAVTTAKIADSNVTTGKIGDGQVTTAKIADSNVTTAKIADSNVTTAKIADANVTTTKIADNNVTTGKLQNGAVTNAKQADMAEGTVKMRPPGLGSGAPQDTALDILRSLLGMVVVDEYEYNGGGTETWGKRPGAIAHEFLYVGGGGPGGSVSGGVGGGGGGAGAIMRMAYPAFAVPEELNIQVGSSGSDTNIYNDDTSFTLQARGGSAGANGGVGGAAGLGGLNLDNTGGAGGATTGGDGLGVSFGGAKGTGGTNAPGKGGKGYGAGGGGGAGASDGGGGGAGGYGHVRSGAAAADGTSTVGGAGMTGYVCITTWLGAWYPQALGASLALELDGAMDVTSDTGGASVWGDQSSSADDATQSSSGLRPTIEALGWNSAYPSLLINGETTGDFMIADDAAAIFSGDDTPYTISWVGQVVGNPTGLRIVLCVGATSNDFAVIRFAVNTSDQWEVFTRDAGNTGSRTITGSAYDTNRHQHTLRFNGTTLQYWVDGVSQGTSATALGSSTFTRFTLGGMRRSTGAIENPIDVRMVGVTCVNRALTDTELQLLWTYNRSHFGGLP